ncbi:MAG: phosphotransferase [Alphaproteobacteria bacterium]|nr:phosphotransferase [Alphaproteobacteria bacterium]MDE2341259.1 phosphotransferase [Alphaproteobacteria bacterium]
MTPPKYAEAFLHQAGWQDATILPLAGDASFRRYFRVRRGADKAVLMDAPPPHEDPRPFIAIAQGLAAQGFRTPRILTHDLALGLVLLEDFGDVRMRERLDADPDREADIYRAVVDLLVELGRHPALALAPYDLAAYQRETALFIDWYCPALGLDVDAQGFVAAWEQVLYPVVAAQNPPVTVLRDYHAENIMLLGDANIVSTLGLLDFQDALAGHAAYDLVSMLQDARHAVSADLEQQMLAHYCAATGAGAAFIDAYHILGAQRNVKILGIFTRLWKRDNKPHYRVFQPRVWAYLERDLEYPVLAPVRDWFVANVPHEMRAAAWSRDGN